MKLQLDLFRCLGSRSCWGRRSSAPSGRVRSNELKQSEDQYPISNIQYPISNEGSDRQGIALIVVLGFLSIMLMMAVAFLTQARVERLVAGASLEGMRTRQMAQTAIAAAMQDYLNGVVEVSQADAKHRIFLSGDMKGSLGFYYSGLRIGDDRLAIGAVEDWLLDWHLQDALGAGLAEDRVRNAEWIWVRERPGQRSRILGRYAYACFDMSGLIDANLLGTAYGDDVPKYGAFTNRNNVRKMVLDAVSSTPKTGGDRQYKLNIHQRIWKGFDSPAALLNLTDGTWNDGRNSGPNRWEGADMVEGAGIDAGLLSSYSYSVLHKEDGGGKQKVLCTSANIKAQPEFSRILAGASPAEVIKALQDYESTDILPQGVDYPSVKNVPMFNEIGIRVGLKKTEDSTDTNGLAVSKYDLQIFLKTEFWFPFAKAAGSFQFQPTIGAGPNDDGAANIWVQIQGLGPGGPIYLEANGTANSVNVGATPGRPYFANGVNTDNEIEINAPLTEVGGGAWLPQNMQLRVGLMRVKPLELKQGTYVVDSTPVDGDFELLIRPIPVLVDGDKTPEVESWEVSDPRLNHLIDMWDQSGPSWETTNNAAIAARNVAESEMGYRPGEYLYCRNGPIEYPGELGYLSNGKPWGTLDIFNEDGIQLMNRLICAEDIFDIVNGKRAFFTNGTINPNTRYTNVLNAAFYGLDMREVPGMADDPKDNERLSKTDLDPLVGAIMADPKKLTTGINGQAGWARALASSALPDEINKNNRIAIFNNTWGLFNESDRLFVVVVIAQAIKEGEEKSGIGNWDEDEDMITGERRAVALGWMDSSADVGGQLAREMNIIMFQYLNE